MRRGEEEKGRGGRGRAKEGGSLDLIADNKGEKSRVREGGGGNGAHQNTQSK